MIFIIKNWLSEISARNFPVPSSFWIKYRRLILSMIMWWQKLQYPLPSLVKVSNTMHRYFLYLVFTLILLNNFNYIFNTALINLVVSFWLLQHKFESLSYFHWDLMYPPNYLNYAHLFIIKIITVHQVVLDVIIYVLPTNLLHILYFQDYLNHNNRCFFGRF